VASTPGLKRLLEFLEFMHMPNVMSPVQVPRLQQVDPNSLTAICGCRIEIAAQTTDEERRRRSCRIRFGTTRTPTPHSL
jgi:hypothetical protein